MYMDVGNFQTGFLVAKGFTTGAKVVRDYIQKTHEKDIKLSAIGQVPIGHQPTTQEREDYY